MFGLSLLTSLITRPAYETPKPLIMTAPFALPETPADMLDARVEYYQTEKNTNGLPRVVSTGVVVDYEIRYGTMRVRVQSDNPNLITKWHIAQDAIIAYIWEV
jgi:hypothetical protein